MRKHVSFLPILSFILMFSACGTHKHVVSNAPGKEKKHPIKEVKANIEYKGLPWVENVSSPTNITKGLQNKHIAVWASHGRYYNNNKGQWTWQRPNLFCTNEDLFTQTIVVPYLIPMLENAGANVFSPRERDASTILYRSKHQPEMARCRDKRLRPRRQALR